MIKHVNFQLYSAYPEGVIWKKMTIDDEYVSDRIRFFIHKIICLQTNL